LQRLDRHRLGRRAFDRLRAIVSTALPHHALSRLVWRLTRVRSRAVVPVIRWFVRRFGVDLSEAAESDPRRYEHFNAFFTRALRAGARPLAGDASTLVSPVDGRVSRAGPVQRDQIVQAKGQTYSLAALLGGDPEAARRFEGGVFATLYLAPGDYHRIHMPLAGELTRMRYIPGRLFSVAPWSVRAIDGLFTRNERVCTFFETTAGPMALVLVGALNVAAIETRWSGVVTPPRGRRMAGWSYTGRRIALDRGEEMGRFNMGSTVVVVAPAPTQLIETRATPEQSIRMGQALAHTHARAP
jgi:phosphatidylserine decarboxylase